MTLLNDWYNFGKCNKLKQIRDEFRSKNNNAVKTAKKDFQ